MKLTLHLVIKEAYEYEVFIFIRDFLGVFILRLLYVNIRTSMGNSRANAPQLLIYV